MPRKKKGRKLGSGEWIVFVISGKEEACSEILVKADVDNILMVDRFCQARCNDKRTIRVEIPGVVSQAVREVVRQYF